MSRFRGFWEAWKSLRLPWRQTRLVGKDPSGNVYYEKVEKGRVYPRRWVELTTDKNHYSEYDVNKVP
ncbi:hypothetical protein H4R35_004426, partial [Dimargaris xerosporica]